MTRDVVWRPAPSYLEGSNLKRFMDRHGIATYDEVVRRSIADVAWFWEAVQQDLGIEWSEPYSTVLDTSRGIEFPAWFLGGRVNITRNCVDRHAEGPLGGAALNVGTGGRVNLLEPETSLILLKATGSVAHEGGQRFRPESPEYAAFLAWLRDGGNDDRNAPALKKLTLGGIDIPAADVERLRAELPGVKVEWTEPSETYRKRIRALWIIATNPIVSFPNLGVLKQALQELEFLVVQDGFHPTPTSELAHLVLPAAIWGEKEGTYTNSERRVSKVNKAVEPRGEARSDFDIFLAVAEEILAIVLADLAGAIESIFDRAELGAGPARAEFLVQVFSRSPG